MKIMMVEVNAEELSANRRIADVLIDAVTNFTDAFARGVTAEDVANAMSSVDGESKPEDLEEDE